MCACVGVYVCVLLAHPDLLNLEVLLQSVLLVDTAVPARTLWCTAMCVSAGKWSRHCLNRMHILTTSLKPKCAPSSKLKYTPDHPIWWVHPFGWILRVKQFLAEPTCEKPVIPFCLSLICQSHDFPSVSKSTKSYQLFFCLVSSAYILLSLN